MYRKGVSAIIINDKSEFLLVNLESFEDKYFAIPGGGVELEETLEDAVYRELNEELGIKQKHLQIVGQSSIPVKFKFKEIKMNRDGIEYEGSERYFFGFKFIGNDSDIKILEGEIRSYKWVSWSGLKDYLLFDNQLVETVEKILELFPFFKINKRIIIIGDAGRGKSTLAEKMSEKLGIKKYSTDDFYYEFKYFKAREREIALEQVNRVYKEDSWIVEGTTQWLFVPGLDLADLIIYLRYKNIFIQWWVIIRRHFHRKDESIKSMLILLRHVFYKRYRLGYKKGKPTHTEVLAPYKDKVVVLSSFKEIDVFISKI